jgi:hypothetical protein
MNESKNFNVFVLVKKFGWLAAGCGIVTMLFVVANSGKNYDPSHVNSRYDDSSNINGIVGSLSFYKSFVTFTLRGSEQRFTIYAYYNAASQERDFVKFIRRGDSIVKGSFSDSIYVFRNGRAYAWSVRGK